MTRDLFGKAVFESSKATQPALFGDLHWFTLGYMDCWEGGFQASASNAYRLGFEAATRDMTDGRGCNPDSAIRQARAVGNVQE